MDNCIFIRLLLYLIYTQVSKAENVLFVQKKTNGFNLTCVGSENSILTWIGNNNDYKTQPDNLFKGSKIKLRNSYNFNLPPVLDWRWKDFRKESCKCGNTCEIISKINDVKVLTISMRYHGSIKLKLNDLYEVILNQNLLTKFFIKKVQNAKVNCVNLDLKTPWRHYNLYLNNGWFYFSKTAAKTVDKFELSSLKIEALGSDVEYAVHNYNVISVDNFNLQSKNAMCRSVFYYSQRKCRLNINEQTNQIDGMPFWKESILFSENLKFSSQNQIIVDVRKCNFEKNNVISIKGSMPFGCQDISNESELSLAVSKPKPISTGDVCKNYEEMCKNRLVCRKDGCFCLQKYAGDYCEEDKSLAVKINPCEGRWGPNCENVCSVNCRNGYCHKSTGICLNGCKAKFYGSHCLEECPKNCNFDTCDVSRGECLNGCLPNFRGVKCENCIKGKWGPDCNSKCDGRCKNQTCERSDGSCAGGCVDGYFGKFCEAKCGRGCYENKCMHDGHCNCRYGYDTETNCQVYRYLHQEPKLMNVGPSWIALQINSSELNEHTKIKIFEEEKACNVTNSQDFYNITNLQPGVNYVFEIVVCYKIGCEIGNHLNTKISYSTCLELNTSTMQFKSFATSITINHSKKGTFCERYLLHYKSKYREDKIDFNPQTEITKLTPFTDYEIKIVSSDEEEVYTTMLKTTEAPSSEPLYLECFEDEFVKWSKPLNPNGAIKHFNVFVNDTLKGEVLFSEDIDVFSYKLNLTNAAIYKINVQAVNSYPGEKAEIIIRTKPPEPKIVITTPENCDFCNVDVILENKFNSTIYEIQNNGNECDGNIVQKKELREENIITLIGVSRNSTICVENNFFGKKSIAKVIPRTEDPDMRYAQFSFLYLLICIPFVIAIIVTVVILSLRNKSKTNTSPEDVEPAVRLIPKETINLFEETSINRNQLEGYLKNLICREAGAAHLDSEFSYIDIEPVHEKKTFGQLEANSYKNRYKDVIPYDATRVILKDVVEDYINANYVQGYNGDKTYIATQCPKSITENDFWWMVWQEEVVIIVMLSTLSDGLHQMTSYWPPENSSKDYRKVKVRHVETVHRTDFMVRTFVITFEEKEKKVTHINYTTWPDKKIPLFPLSLIDFIKYVQIIRGNNESPIVVHCSAGLGRTGAYIMCDKYFNTNDEIINIPQTLATLRTCRSSLVQTNSQYRLIYFIINEIISMDAAKDVSLEVIKTIDTSTIKELVSNDMHYINERLFLNNLLYRKAKPLDENQKANRNPRIGAVSESTIILPEYHREKDSTYINAVYVHGYNREYKFISTQIPLRNTVREFWRMIYQTTSDIIIVLQNIHSNDESVSQFWPTFNEPSLKPTNSLEVLYESEYDEAFYTVYNLEISLIKKDDTRKLKLFSFKAWDTEKSLPNSMENFFTLYNDVCAFDQPRSKITLCCIDGAIGCGLYIAFDLLFNKLKTDNVFNICWAIRSIKNFRTDFINTDEQLIFLYEMAKYYIKQTNSIINEPDYENLLNLVKEMENY